MPLVKAVFHFVPDYPFYIHELTCMGAAYF